MPSSLLSTFTSIPDRHEVFGILIRELTRRVERRFPNPSPLEQNSARAWTLIASRTIYNYTGDVVSGSLACAVLISFLISPHETPTYVFLIWATYLVLYLILWPIMENVMRSIPDRHEVFGILIRELTRRVERRFPNASPLEQNSARAWTLIASRTIYNYTGDVVSGSLACAVLISFLISPHETPTYVFLIWAMYLVLYLILWPIMENMMR